MTPELAHWLSIGIKGLLFYFIGLPLVFVIAAVVIGFVVIMCGASFTVQR